jgi:hypothetical protein
MLKVCSGIEFLDCLNSEGLWSELADFNEEDEGSVI